jgi:hypothetical protein
VEVFVAGVQDRSGEPRGGRNFIASTAARSQDIRGVIPALAEVVVGLTIVVAMGIYRLRRSIEFEVTRDALAIRPRRSAGGIRAVTFARADVREVRLNPYNGKLLVRVRGREAMEVFISPNREVAAFVARTLEGSWGAAAEAEAPLPGVAVSGVDRVMGSRASRNVGGALVVGVTLGGVGVVVVTWVAWPGAVGQVALAAGVVAAIVAGFVFGTQEKDVWI